MTDKITRTDAEKQVCDIRNRMDSHLTGSRLTVLTKTQIVRQSDTLYQDLLSVLRIIEATGYVGLPVESHKISDMPVGQNIAMIGEYDSIASRAKAVYRVIRHEPFDRERTVTYAQCVYKERNHQPSVSLGRVYEFSGYCVKAYETQTHELADTTIWMAR